MDKKQKEKLSQAIYKKALGYKSEEIVKEFGKNNDGELELIKQKTSTKHNSPDISAAKLVLELGENFDDYDSMSIEQLQLERDRLREIYKIVKNKENDIL
ncbi:MAG: hypothetical protein FWF56_05955 [Firmicutes bacterium]|nr:hypothetical protein [Bacillota bacterium]MCL1953547.1 hypothetical protein [Bacillota bacterium]